MQFLAHHNDDIKAITLENVPANLKLASPDIQNDIVSAAAAKTIGVILKDLGDVMFSIFFYESWDISVKEQTVVVLRYVDKNGRVIELFIGIDIFLVPRLSH